MENFESITPIEIEEYPLFTTGRGEILEECIDNYIAKMNEIMDEAISSSAGEYAVIEALRDNMINLKEQISNMDTEMDLLLLKIQGDIFTKEDNLNFEGV